MKLPELVVKLMQYDKDIEVVHYDEGSGETSPIRLIYNASTNQLLIAGKDSYDED